MQYNAKNKEYKYEHNNRERERERERERDSNSTIYRGSVFLTYVYSSSTPLEILIQ
jgi:hypothetical protein